MISPTRRITLDRPCYDHFIRESLLALGGEPPPQYPKGRAAAQAELNHRGVAFRLPCGSYTADDIDEIVDLLEERGQLNDEAREARWHGLTLDDFRTWLKQPAEIRFVDDDAPPVEIEEAIQ